MRLIFTSDLHGNLALYQSLLDLAITRCADLVVVGGDLLPHTMQRFQAIGLQSRFLEQLAPLLAQALHNLPTLRVFLLPGNDDWLAATHGLEALEQAGLALTLHGQSRQVAPNLWLAGYACVPLTPFSIKDFERSDEGLPPPVDHSFAMAYHSSNGKIEPISKHEFASRPSIAAELEALATLSDPTQTIYICHTPPHNTALDLMRNNKHVGSVALRRFIEHHQPLATFHGHIHEAPRLSKRFAERIGTTLLVAAGQDGTRLHAVVCETNALTSLWHTIYGTTDV